MNEKVRGSVNRVETKDQTMALWSHVGYRVFWLPVLVALAAALGGCEQASETPAPNEATKALDHVRAGYNGEDMETFCGDFSDIMFTQGFTKQAYLDVVQGLKKKLGNWQSETYLGEKDGAHTWRAQFDKGTAKVIVVLNDTGDVTGLWFR